MENKNLNDKSKTNVEFFLDLYANFADNDQNLLKFIEDKRSEDLLKHETFRDCLNDPLFNELKNEPDYKKISIIETDIDGDQEKTNLEGLIRDFYGSMRFGELKKKFRAFVFTCTTGEQCLIEQPGVKETNEIMKFVDIMTQKVDAMRFGNYLVSQCWLSGDDEIRKDENLFFQLGMIGMSIVEIAVAHVKKN